MRDFNRDSRGGGGRDFGNRGFGNRGADRQMFKAICSKCGKECEVPFKPTGSKPVFCSDCFREQGGPDRRSEGRRDSRPAGNTRNDFGGGRSSDHPQYKEQFEALNNKLDKILKILAPSTSTNTTQEEVVVPEKKKRVVKKVEMVQEPVVEPAQEVILTPEEAPKEEI